MQRAFREARANRPSRWAPSPALQEKLRQGGSLLKAGANGGEERPPRLPPRAIEPNTTGFISPLLPDRDHVPYRSVLWNEFLGALMFALAFRLFVGFFGGSTFAASIPTLYGTAFVGAFAYFGALAVFGAVSGGHFNPAITLCIMLIELFARFGWFGEFQWKGSTRRPWRNWFGLIPYFLVQFVAFLLAALLIWGFLPGTPRAAPIALGIPFVTGTVSNGKTFGVEIVGSFMFLACYVLLLKMFGGDKSWLGQAIRALAFGFWYFALILVFAPWASAVWNPSLWLAFAIVSGRYTDWWVLGIPAFISAVAASLFCLLHWWISRKGGLKEIRGLELRPRFARKAQRQANPIVV